MTNETKYKYLIDQWDEFETKIDEKMKNEIDEKFKQFVSNITADDDNKLKLEEYTNLKTDKENYFCTFMENTSSPIYGSASAGNAEYFGIKKNDDGSYFISNRINSKLKENIVKQEEAETSFNKVLLPYLKSISIKEGMFYKLFEKIEEKNIVTSKVMLRKFVAMNNSGKFLYIYSDDAIDIIYDFFLGGSDDASSTNIAKNEAVSSELKNIFKDNSHEKDNHYMIKLSRFIWSIFGASIQLESKNMILHGAPGTGKTYSIKNTVKNIILKQGGNLDRQLVFTQFHPSYSYEDFIDGIKPTGIDDQTGQLKLKLKNGAFKELCINASKKLKEERENGIKDKSLTKFFFVADEINRAELSRVFGELLICLEEDYRIDFDKEGKILKEENLIATQNSSLDTEPVYQMGNKSYFGVPTNLYFLGTMNDIDKSVDSFDMALRRRFYWKEIRCNYGYIDSLYNNVEFTKICINLNRYITGYKEDKKNTGKMNKVKKVGKYEPIRLGTSFELGHAYFKDIVSINQTSINKLWDSKIEPLLKEYLRAEYSQDDIVNKLSEAKEIFSLPKKTK